LYRLKKNPPFSKSLKPVLGFVEFLQEIINPALRFKRPGQYVPVALRIPVSWRWAPCLFLFCCCGV
jgi:hypothetical protein